MPRPRPPIVATTGRIAALDQLRPLLSPWPAVFPTSADPIIKPLAVGPRQALRDRLMVPDGMNADEAWRIVAAMIRSYATSTGYLLAVSQPDSRRHDLNGKPVGSISDQHRQDAKASFDHRQKLKAEGVPWPPRHKKPVGAAVEPPAANLADASIEISAPSSTPVNLTGVTDEPVTPEPVAPATVELPPTPKLGKGGRPILKLKAPVRR